jgi:tetratricopeptide (TPR) repeat protein
VTGAKRDKLQLECQRKGGPSIKIFEREWLRHRLEEQHQDLAKKYFNLELPSTIAHAASQIEICDLNGTVPISFPGGVSKETVRANILRSTEVEPTRAQNWKALARLESYLRNFDAALEAVNKALSFDRRDVNLQLLRAVILADMGIERRSRPLLVEAKEVLLEATDKIGRPVDHYNLANVLRHLGEYEQSERHYRECLRLEPQHAQAWHNLGGMFLDKRSVAEAIECFESALREDPRLVEAHISLATTNLIFCANPQAAIRYFQSAYDQNPELDRTWKYARYWYCRALCECGEIETALRELNVNLKNRPGDVYLLDQKAEILSRLWRDDAKWVPPAFEFFRFRARALKNDFLGLTEVIELCIHQNRTDDAWALIDDNIGPTPVNVSEIARRANVSLEMLCKGFRSTPLFRSFRSCMRSSDHCATLCSYGLRPNEDILQAVEPLLMTVFAEVAARLGSCRGPNSELIIAQTFDYALERIGCIVAAGGCHWLTSKPGSHDERISFLALGVLYLPDIVVAEASRQTGFITGKYALPRPKAKRKNGWRDICADIGARLILQVGEDWGIRGGSLKADA